jgi:hypothetical protein
MEEYEVNPEASTAYAGYGLRLCTNYTGWFQCEEEDTNGHYNKFLRFSTQRQSLCCTGTCCAVPTSFYILENGSSNFNLRSNAIHDNPADEYY